MLKYSLLLVLAVAACGDDPAPAKAPVKQPAPGGAPAKAGRTAASAANAKTKTLASRIKAEDKVSCPLPETLAKGAKTCDAQAKLCEPVPAGDPKNYCLAYTDGKHYCLPCAERDAIRQVFSERDFAAEQSNRDPFQSFVLAQKGLAPLGDTGLPREITKDCSEKNMVASNFGYHDLRLVGIVAERAQRRVLMMDPGNLGHIIKKNDCVGREKAIVKDIGAGYVTFQVKPDELLPNGQPRPVEEHSVQLYPNQLTIISQPRYEQPGTGAPAAPVVAPPTPGANPEDPASAPSPPPAP